MHFTNCKRAILNQVKLALRGPSKCLSIYTDASDDPSSGIASQIPESDLHMPRVEKCHTLLAFISGRVNATQLRWSVTEKEAFAVVASLTCLHWPAGTSSAFDLYIDHNNLVFLFDTLSSLPDLSQSRARKVPWCAVRLSTYNYVCHHISAEDNIWADHLVCWSPPPIVRRLLFIPPHTSISEEDFPARTFEESARVQSTGTVAHPENLKLSDIIWKNSSGSIWVRPNGNGLHL